jgi:hypothetical protein
MIDCVGWNLEPALKDLIDLDSHGFTQFLMRSPDGQKGEIK